MQELICHLGKLKLSCQLTFLRKIRDCWSTGNWEGRGTEETHWSCRGSFDNFSRDLIVLQNELTVERWCIGFMVIWKFALGYFSRKEGGFDVYFQKHIPWRVMAISGIVYVLRLFYFWGLSLVELFMISQKLSWSLAHGIISGPNVKMYYG
jgi:hypothetical protein